MEKNRAENVSTQTLTPLSESGQRHKIRDLSFGFEQIGVGILCSLKAEIYLYDYSLLYFGIV